MENPPPLPSDGQLLIGTRNGAAGSWEELQRRHIPAVTGVARARQRVGARKATERALEALRVDIESDDPAALTADGVRAVRPRLVSKLSRGTYGPGESVDASVDSVVLHGDDGRVELDDLSSIARAYSTLPEPWQTALWHRIVEQQSAAEVAPHVGRSAVDAAAFVQRADAGLFEAYLLDQREHADVSDECAPIIPLLGGSLRSTLSAHEQRLVDDHLGANPGTEPDAGDARGCDACDRRMNVSRELAVLLPAAIVPALAGLSLERYRAGSGARPAIDLADPDDRRRRFAFIAVFSALLLTAGAAVVFSRDSLEIPGADSVNPTGSTEPGAATTEPGTAVTEPGAATTEPAATTTTEVPLRPDPGPVHSIAIDFDDTKAAGLAPTESDLSAVLSSPGPVFAGGTGTFDLDITNTADVAAESVASLNVPMGIEFDALVDGPAECVDPEDDSVKCTVTVGAGATERVTFRFRLENAIVGRLLLGSNLADDAIEVPITALHRLVHSSVDHGQIIVVGNTLMTCDETAAECADARDGVGSVLNRWDLPAKFVGSNPSFGIFNSSSAMVDLGEGTVEAAYLFWSGDLNERGQQIPDDGRTGQVSLVPPGEGQPVQVEADRVRLGDVDATQYFGSADVTEVVRANGTGSYTVANVQSIEVQGSYAGWALVVVTSDDTLPRRSNTVVSPFAWFAPGRTYNAQIDVPYDGVHAAELDVVAFEGERGFVPEHLQVANEELGDSVFDSTITGERSPAYDNNFGIDIDVYDLQIDATPGTLPIEASSSKDGIRLAVLALAVDIE